ncbi:MAG TPA: hypothetical protein VNE39_22270 [Planctomycetota bacterium]|nr:hypothetical protein [Planctomycetota bacterium]
MRRGTGKTRSAFVAIELLVVVAVIAVLLGLGYSVYRGARLSARVATAESNLKQIGTALDLFFQRYGTYPPQGVDLVDVLKPFLVNAEVLSNPLMDEETLGQTLSDLYVEPTGDKVDRPNIYVTAFASDNGSTVVVLKSNGVVERLDGLSFDPTDAAALVSMLVSGGNTTETGDTTTEEGPGTDTLDGEINLNPSNSDDFDFEMYDNTDPGELIVDREALLASDGGYTFDYDPEDEECKTPGNIRFKPKGNGNQNRLILNGKQYNLRNGVVYVLKFYIGVGTDRKEYTVRVYNKGTNGAAMGRWWMQIKTPKKGADLFIQMGDELIPAGH